MSLEQIIIIFIIVVLAIAAICVFIMVYEIIKERLEKRREKKEAEKCDYHFELPYKFDSKEEYLKSYKELIANKGINRQITRAKIKFFEGGDGKVPFLEFLNSIESDELKENIVKEIYNLCEQGEYLNDTDQSLYLGDDIFCLVVDIENDNELVIYYYADEVIDTVILLNGATIKCKIDNIDAYKLAKVYRDEYMKQISEEKNSKEEPKKDSNEAIEITKVNK